MRILRFFLFSLLGIFIFSLIGFFLGREVLLVYGSSMLKSDYNNLFRKNYAEQCVRQFDYSQDYWTQIRFISNKEYNLEVVCADFVAAPIVLASKKLPPLLFKKTSGSGFLIDQRELPFFIELSALGRELFVYTDNQEMHSNYFFKPDLDYEAGPLSSCQAHNYRCCSLEVESGLGEQITAVNDCPKSCFTSCLLRPVVLSFNGRPALDDETRTIEVGSGEAVTLSYVLGNGKTDVFTGQLNKEQKQSFLEKLQTIFSKNLINQSDDELALPVQVTIDLGDGQIFQSTNLQDSFDHIYTCQTGNCYFNVKLTALDARGVLSVDNELAKMIIKVN